MLKIIFQYFKTAMAYHEMHIILLAFYETALLMKSMSHCIISLKKDSKKILNKGSEASVCYTFEPFDIWKKNFYK